MAAINVAKKLCATQKQILWHTTSVSAIYRLTMSKYETLAEQLFGSSDDDADLHDLHTQGDNRLTFDSPRSSDSETTSSEDKFISNDAEDNLSDSDDEASNHRRVDQNRSPSPENPLLARLERQYGRPSLSSSSSTSSSSSKNSSSKKRNNC